MGGERLKGAPGVALAIDTAGPVVGAALVVHGEATARWSWSARVVRGADAVLLPAVAEALDLCRDTWAGRGPEMVAVSVGPGAFTGLRVGVATALGLAVSLGIRVAPVSALQARAARCGGGSVLALLDARKRRVYAGHFDCTGAAPRPLGPEVDDAIGAVLPQAPFTAVGEGVNPYRDEILAGGGAIAPDADHSPAAQVGWLGLLEGAPLEPAGVRLRYIRPPDATIPASLARRRSG